MSTPEIARSSGPHRIEKMRPLVALVGRPNVGKSTLFNRLVQARRAITDDRPGVTRDLLYADVVWDGRRFTLVDTGGYVPDAPGGVSLAVATQAEAVIREADLILLICDATEAVTDLDRSLADLVRRSGRAWLLVANKLDSAESERRNGAVLHELGLGDPQPVSAATGRRSGDLLETLIQRLGAAAGPVSDKEEPVLRAVLAGRPNVGKSTLMNRLAGEQVSLVHEQPGTTRDSTSVRLEYRNRDIMLTDTAGLRRRSRVRDPVEFYSSRRATNAIEHADVAVVLLDAAEGITMQDARIIGQTLEAGCGMVLGVNKWDLAQARGADSRPFVQQLHRRFPFVVDYPVVFLSGLTGRGVSRCLDWILRVEEHRGARIPTARLNSFVRDIMREHPPYGGGREVKVLYATQAGTSPPSFVFFVTRPDLINGTYRRYVEKRLREEFGFQGTPVRTGWRARRGR